MDFYTILSLCILLKLAMPLFTSRWPKAYKCNLDSVMPRCCIYAREIVPELENEVCIVEDRTRGTPYRFSVLIDDFPACTVYRSGSCLFEAEICVRFQKHIFICQTSLSLTFKQRAVEWCFSSYLKVYGIKLYKFSKLCAYFSESYFLLPRKLEDLLIDAGF